MYNDIGQNIPYLKTASVITFIGGRPNSLDEQVVDVSSVASSSLLM